MKKYLIIIACCPLFLYGQTDSLNQYLKTAAENNPAVKAAFLTYQASLQKIPQAGAYEDPQLEMGVFLEPMELTGGRQIAQFQLMQMFPWFGTKKAARTEAQHMSQMAFEAFREAKDNLYLEVYTQWYALCALQQQVLNSEKNKQLLQQMESLALQKYVAGNGNPGQQTQDRQSANNTPAPVAGAVQGMNMNNAPAVSQAAPMSSGGMKMGGSPVSGMSEVLRIQMEIIALESNLESLSSNIAAGKLRFNTLLNRPVASGVHLPSEIMQLPFSFDAERGGQAVVHNPMLGMLKEETLAYKAQAEMSKKMFYPMLGIGLQYMLIAPAAMSMSENMNGKDMLMPMVSVSIPVYRRKYRAAQRESQLLQQAGQEKFNDTFNRLQADWAQTVHQLNDEARKIALYKKQTALAQTTYDLAVQEFISGTNDLNAVIQIQRQFIEYQSKTADAIAAYNTMVVTIQKITSSYENDN
jgi:outer membrane protein TolC